MLRTLCSSCERFGYDDTANAPLAFRHFLSVDYSIECRGNEYQVLVHATIGFIALWPLGIPLFFLFLLSLARNTSHHGGQALLRATSFLHGELITFRLVFMSEGRSLESRLDRRVPSRVLLLGGGQTCAPSCSSRPSPRFHTLAHHLALAPLALPS